jgi:hypothetical protein
MLQGTTHYIATTDDLTAIYGLGPTPEAALADAHEGGASGELITMRATPALVAKVEADGGAGFAWRIVDTANRMRTVPPRSSRALADMSEDYLIGRGIDPETGVDAFAGLCD